MWSLLSLFPAQCGPLLCAFCFYLRNAPSCARVPEPFAFVLVSVGDIKVLLLDLSCTEGSQLCKIQLEEYFSFEVFSLYFILCCCF